MKKSIFVLGAVIALAACSDDDESFNYGQLTKKWYNVSEKVGGETFPYEDHESCGKDYVEFLSNGTGRFVDVVACEPGVITDDYEFDWSRSGKKITVAAGIENQTVTINKLTSNTLEIKAVYDYDDDGEDDTVISVYTSNPN